MTDKELIVDINRLCWLLEEDRQYRSRAGTAKAAADRIKAQAAEIKKLRGDLKKAVDAASSAAVDWLHGDYGMSEARAADLGIYSFVKRAALEALRGAKP